MKLTNIHCDGKSLSLPTLRLNDGKIFVEFYFYPSGGAIDNCQIWLPYYRALSQFDRPYAVDFIPIDPQELGTISTEQPLGSVALFRLAIASARSSRAAKVT